MNSYTLLASGYLPVRLFPLCGVAGKKGINYYYNFDGFQTHNFFFDRDMDPYPKIREIQISIQLAKQPSKKC